MILRKPQASLSIKFSSISFKLRLAVQRSVLVPPLPRKAHHPQVIWPCSCLPTSLSPKPSLPRELLCLISSFPRRAQIHLWPSPFPSWKLLQAQNPFRRSSPLYRGQILVWSFLIRKVKSLMYCCEIVQIIIDTKLRNLELNHISPFIGSFENSMFSLTSSRTIVFPSTLG